MRARRTHSDDFSTKKREGCLGQHSPPAKEATFCAGDTIELDERTRVFPIAEAETIVIRTTAEVKDYTQNDQTCRMWPCPQYASTVGEVTQKGSYQ